MTAYKAIAKRGENTYLVDVRGDVHDKDATACVYDARTNTLYPRQSAHSIIARGYWEPYAGEVTGMADLAADAPADGEYAETPDE